MTLSRLARAAIAAGALVLASGGLAGCEFAGEFGATCTTSPPVPHHEFGTVAASIDVPWVVHPGQEFDVRVDALFGYAGPPPGGGGSIPGGTLSVAGPVRPSGNLNVGQSLGGGTAFPNTLHFEVTGQPGEAIRFGAVAGHSFEGTFPNGVYVNCDAGDQEIVTIQIVEPEQSP